MIESRSKLFKITRWPIIFSYYPLCNWEGSSLWNWPKKSIFKLDFYYYLLYGFYTNMYINKPKLIIPASLHVPNKQVLFVFLLYLIHGFFGNKKLVAPYIRQFNRRSFSGAYHTWCIFSVANIPYSLLMIIFWTKRYFKIIKFVKCLDF